MTVRQLINKLKKLPQGLEVYIADHDHSDYEVSNKAHSVLLVDKSLMSEEEYKNHTCTKDFKGELDSLPKKYISIHG